MRYRVSLHPRGCSCSKKKLVEEVLSVLSECNQARAYCRTLACWPPSTRRRRRTTRSGNDLLYARAVMGAYVVSELAARRHPPHLPACSVHAICVYAFSKSHHTDLRTCAMCTRTLPDVSPRQQRWYGCRRRRFRRVRAAAGSGEKCYRPTS